MISARLVEWAAFGVQKKLRGSHGPYRTFAWRAATKRELLTWAWMLGFAPKSENR